MSSGTSRSTPAKRPRKPVFRSSGRRLPRRARRLHSRRNQGTPETAPETLLVQLRLDTRAGWQQRGRPGALRRTQGGSDTAKGVGPTAGGPSHEARRPRPRVGRAGVPGTRTAFRPVTASAARPLADLPGSRCGLREIAGLLGSALLKGTVNALCRKGWNANSG